MFNTQWCVRLMCAACYVLCVSGAIDDEGRVWIWGHGMDWQLGHGSRHHDCEPQQVWVRLRKHIDTSAGCVPSIQRHGQDCTYCLSGSLVHLHVLCARQDCTRTVQHCARTSQSTRQFRVCLKFLLCSLLVLLCMVVQLRGLHNVHQLVLGFNHSMSIGKHGDVYSWGTDENGSLGHGFKWPTVAAQRPTPVPVRLVGGAAGWKHTAGAWTMPHPVVRSMSCRIGTRLFTVTASCCVDGLALSCDSARASRVTEE